MWCGSASAGQGVLAHVLRPSIRLFASLCIAGSATCGTTGDSAAPAGPPQRTASVDLRIGVEEGGDEETFSGVTGLALDARGRIYAADRASSEVRVFAPDGTFRFRIGRQGAGPGEFNGLCCLGFDRTGRLWVRDGGNARYNVFAVGDDAASFLFSVRMAHADVNFWAPVHFDDTGHVIDIGHRPRGDRLDLVHLHLDTTGVVVDSVNIPATPTDSIGVRVIERATPQGMARRYLYPPFGPLELLAHGSGGEYAKAVSSVYRIAWYDPDGVLQRVIERPDVQTGAAVTAEERAQAEERSSRDAQRFNLSASERFPVPDHKPPLSSLAFDDRTRLWVMRSVEPGSPRRADVWAGDGTLAFTAEWPADIDLRLHAVITDSIAIAVARDSLDVERIVRLRWN